MFGFGDNLCDSSWFRRFILDDVCNLTVYGKEQSRYFTFVWQIRTCLVTVTGRDVINMNNQDFLNYGNVLVSKQRYEVINSIFVFIQSTEISSSWAHFCLLVFSVMVHEQWWPLTAELTWQSHHAGIFLFFKNRPRLFCLRIPCIPVCSAMKCWIFFLKDQVRR